MLKKAWAARIGQTPCWSRSGKSSRNAVATTTVGSTNGTSTSARTSPCPRNVNRPTTQASGSPRAIVSAVEAAACQVVNHTSWAVSRENTTSEGKERRPS